MPQHLITPGYKYSAGIGYIAIPRDLDRDKYIKDCYANCRVSMQTEDGGFHNRIPVTPEVMNFIEFPLIQNELGTPVVYITDQQYQYHYIIGRFQKRNSLGDGAEYKFKFSRALNDAHVDISGSAKDRTINLLIDGGDKKGVLTINLFGEGNDSELNIDIQGNLNSNVTGKTNILQSDSIAIKTTDSDGNYSAIEQSANETKIKSGKLSINDGEEPMVLGNKLQALFNSIFDTICKIKTVDKKPLSPDSIAQIILLKTKVQEILSSEGFLNK